jgi:hypothetical protein
MTTLQKIEELIYKGFRETDERLAKHRLETDELFAKHRQETDELLVKHRQETDALWKRSWEETKERWQETDKRLERSFQVTKQEIDRLAKQFDGVADSLGRFAEQTVFPAIKRLFRERGIRLNLFYSNLEAHDLDGNNMETDIAGIGPKCAIVIEVKLRLRQTDVKEFLEKKLPRFFDFFPGFRRPILYGGVAGMSIDKGVDRFAYKKGLFVISQTGDNVQIMNDKKFRPRSFAVTQDNRFPKRKTKRQKA